MGFYYKPLSIFVSFFLLSCFTSICFISFSEATKNGGLTVDLIHRDSPLSPFYNPSSTHFERLRSSFNRSFLRQSFLTTLTSLESTSESQDKFQAPFTPDITGEFLMKIRIGSPAYEHIGFADTGSDLTWTQCLPCIDCYNQTTPFFDPRKSKTYRNISCESNECQDSGYRNSDCSIRPGCHYQATYGGGSYSEGDLAMETFTFDSTSGENVSFPNVVFGCGHNNAGQFDGKESGLIGLGGGSVSIVKQLEESIDSKFSYCLTPLESGVSGKINFGSNAIVTGPNVLSTPIIKQHPDTFYYLILEGISVDNKRLEYNSTSTYGSNASFADGEEGNIIIDSGTAVTFLPESIYVELESTLIESITAHRVGDPRGTNGLCYEKVDSPTIIAHFKGADVVLPQGTVFVEVGKGVFCLTLLSSRGNLAIFGNIHQINYLIGYDLKNQKLNFLPTDCTKFG